MDFEPYTARIVRQILQTLLGGSRSVYELIDSQDASLNEFMEILRTLKQEGVVKLDGTSVSLTEKGRRYCEEQRIKYFGELKCECCDYAGYRISDEFDEVLKIYSTIAEDRPEAIEMYDQGFISKEGVLRRLEFIYERGDANGSIFVVGDDDLFSIAISLTEMPEKVVAVDIDERLVNFINRVAVEYSLRLEALVYDVQQTFPDEFRGKFDVFVTDPVETIPGLKLFLSRGVSTLKGEGCSGYFGITTLEASRKKWYLIQKMIHDMGFTITDIRRKFNVYPGEDKNFFRFQEKLPIVRELGLKIDYDWYKSSLYRIEAIRKPEPLVEGEMIIDEKVYKDEESWATPY
jgi:hypothetical protein